MNVTLKWLFEAFKGGLVLELSFYLCIIFLSVLLLKSFCNPLINSHTFFLVFQKLQKRTNIYIVDSTHIILCSVVIVKFPCLLVLFVPSFYLVVQSYQQFRVMKSLIPCSSRLAI